MEKKSPKEFIYFPKITFLTQKTRQHQQTVISLHK